MNPLVVFIISFASLLYASLCYCSYSQIKDTPWIWLIGFTISGAEGVLWFWLVRCMPNKESTLIISLVWDVLMTSVFIIVPILMFHVRLDWKTSIGFAFCVVGLIILKCASGE